MSLLHQLGESPFLGYAYGYPHKLAYRPLHPALSLAELWQEEEKDALFLYLHLPFCEMRCGFCNLFTTANPEQGLVADYLRALKRQMQVWSQALGPDAQFSRMAIGGGTPTFLSSTELGDLLESARATFRFAPGSPLSVEMSPGTVDAEKLGVLRHHGMTRASIGVQSFIESETRQLGRPQKSAAVQAALALIGDSGVDVFNLDLIYGIEGQTTASWRESLEAAVSCAPEEVYLYPLYVRPLTGLDRIGRKPQDERFLRYQEGRDFLLGHGYRQISMRLFRAEHYPSASGPEYCCQEDGMVGLGAGARSYTTKVHFSSEYAVGKSGVMEIIHSFLQQSDADLGRANYGFVLDEGERRRRYVIKSLLRTDGLSPADYRRCFDSEFADDFPQLGELVSLNLARLYHGNLQLLQGGIDLSDLIGPWLYSDEVNHLIEEHARK